MEKSAWSERLISIWPIARQALIVMPVVHLALCALFLFFYQFSFGHGLSEFYSASDILRVSYRDIGPAYLAFILALTLGIPLGFLYHSDNKYTSGRKSILSRQSFIGIIIAIAGFGLFINSFVWARIHWIFLEKLPISSFITVIMGVGFIIFGVGVFKDKMKEIHFFTTILIFPIIITSWVGASYAEVDKIQYYKELLPERPICKRTVILRSLGEHFLAVDRWDRRIIIDSNCNEKFYLMRGPFGKLVEKIDD